MSAWRSDGEHHAKGHAVVTFGYVSAPVGRLLLIRNESGLCALRFIKFSRAHDAKPGTAFHSGDETFEAEYEWFFRSGEGETFERGKLSSGRGKVSSAATVGVGRLVLPSTSARINCGSIKALRWSYPVYVAMFTGNKLGDTGMRVAPTGWRKVSDVGPSDDRLRWYGYEENRKTLYIPLKDLPGK